MTQGRGGGPASPWQRPSNMGSSRQEPRPSNARGYSIPSSTNKSRLLNSTSPQNRQGWGDAHRNSSSYQRSDANINRDRDQYYNKRRNPNDYRTNGFERDHRPPSRYNDDDRGRATNRGMGYENNYDDRRPIDEGWNRNMSRNDRGGNYHEATDFSSHHSNSNQYNTNNRRGGSNRYDEDRSSNLGPRYRDSRDRPRNMDSRGNLARGRERDFGHNGESFDYDRRQQPQQRPHHERSDFRDNRYANERDHNSSRYSTGREERLGDNSNFGRDEYNDGYSYGHEQSRQNDHRWEATSRGREYYDTNERSGYSNELARANEWNREGTERRNFEWPRKQQGEGDGYTTNGYSDKPNDDNHERGKMNYQEKQSFEHSYNHLRSDIPILDVRSSSMTQIKNENNERKRQREDDGREPSLTMMASKIDRREITSSTLKSPSIESKARQEYDQSKKLKVASSTATLANVGSSSSSNQGIGSKVEERKDSPQPCTSAKVSTCTSSSTTVSGLPSGIKIQDKPYSKNIPVKSSTSLSSVNNKHQIQAKPKPTSKLGIPMRWLKPKAKPKPPVKKVPTKVADDTSKTKKIPSKHPTQKAASRPSSPSDRLVTDSSEDGIAVSSKNASTVPVKSSLAHTKNQKGARVPTAIVTKKKNKKTSNAKPKHAPSNIEAEEEPEDKWDSEAESDESDGGASESDIDEDEDMLWDSKMPAEDPTSPTATKLAGSDDSPQSDEVAKTKSPKLKIRLSGALKHKLNESTKSGTSNNGKYSLGEGDGKKLDEATLKKLERQKKKREKEKALTEKIVDQKPEFDHEKAKLEIEEERRKREEAKPLTAKELRKILQDDNVSGGANQNNWVRRSRRQPNRNLLNSKPVRVLVDKLKYNDLDMHVLKMKKYINDPNAPCAVIDAILNAMEENTNCEALYIQNFNEGMRDQQVIHLLRILQQPTCNIWCLNIGENYNVSDATWEKFTKGLIHTKITHMYASEHTITADMKDEIRFTIRENRKKHDMHINPNNLDVIIQCTHCWWNPINAKVLRPFIKKKGYEHVLKDTEGQGLQGSKSMAPTS